MTLNEISVRPIESHEIERYDELMQTHHYLGAARPIGESLRYVALWHHQWVALLGSIRWRLYAIVAKVVKTGRQLFVKLKEKHRRLLEQVLLALKEFEPPPI